jgi:hypothetical protein
MLMDISSTPKGCRACFNFEPSLRLQQPSRISLARFVSAATLPTGHRKPRVCDKPFTHVDVGLQHTAAHIGCHGAGTARKNWAEALAGTVSV